MDNRNIIYDLQVLFSVDGNNIIYWNKILDKVNNSEDNSQFINYIKNLLINQPNKTYFRYIRFYYSSWKY